MKRLHDENRSKRIKYLQQLQAKKRTALLHAPLGNIKVLNKGSRFYYSFFNSGETTVHYLKRHDKQDMALAKAIVQRSYDQRVLELVTQELSLLEELDSFYQGGDADNLYSTLNLGRQALITPIRMTDEAYIAKWLARSYPRKGFMEGAPVFETKRGDRVRSKSEMGIANDLFDEEIPYLYEVPIRLIDYITGQPYTAHPDFLVLNVKERKEFLWEHFGKIDDPEYAQRSIKKLVEYENAGYYPGENMIVTFETRTFPLTPKEIKQVISHYLR